VVIGFAAARQGGAAEAGRQCEFLRLAEGGRAAFCCQKRRAAIDVTTERIRKPVARPLPGFYKAANGDALLKPRNSSIIW
jgi:hypothetical protein